MKINKYTNDSDGNTIKLDTSNIFYRWKSSDEIVLSCLGLTAGTDLTTIIEEIDDKLCQFSAFNLTGYDLGCLTESYDIYSFKDFAEAISKEVCTIKDGDFQFKLDTLNTNIGYINKPNLTDTCVGYVTGDSIQTVLQKVFNKICEIDAQKKIVVSSPDVTAVDTQSVNLTLCGEKDHTIQADVKIANLNDNRLQLKESGLYVQQLTDVDIGILLDRINSVPALKEKLCNICSFNQGGGGSSNNLRIGSCTCTIEIESVARYNGNNYSVILNTVDLGIAPFHWEVRNNLNYIIVSGDTSEYSILETFQLPSSLPEGTYTIRYTSLNCECTDVKSFNHVSNNGSLISPSITSAIQVCTEDSNIITVNSVAGTNPEVTIVIRNSTNQVLHTITNNLNINSFEITQNGIYIVTAYDADNYLVSSLPVVVNVTCVGTVIPPEAICVTYNVTNFSELPVTVFYINCNNVSDQAIINAQDTAILCMIRNSFTNNEDITFTEISDTCEAPCSFEINSAIIECN